LRNWHAVHLLQSHLNQNVTIYQFASNQALLALTYLASISQGKVTIEES
jgi:hypothetical protein